MHLSPLTGIETSSGVAGSAGLVPMHLSPLTGIETLMESCDESVLPMHLSPLTGIET